MSIESLEVFRCELSGMSLIEASAGTGKTWNICALFMRLLLQRRAREKYHSGGLWTNACCTHPGPGETTDDAAERRLAEELGVVCPLHWVLRTHYRARVGVELVENEVVHLYHGLYVGEVRPDAQEVEGFIWTPRETLLSDIENRPEDYTYWFKHYVRSFADRLFLGAAA